MGENLSIPFQTAGDTIASVGGQLRRRERSAAEVVEQCLRRIDELESQVCAWVIVDRVGAREQARKLDGESAAGRWRGPLHGIPIGIKDIVDVAGFPTAAGSELLETNVAACDATIVERLRQAGAVILGKTVTTPFASFDPPPTRNPWNLERTPGGSSSGSAAAVACGMCLGAIGSQTGGSITRPASFCGVAGCKPTYGRVSTAGVMPLAPTMDHPGPIARTVRDLAILLEAIAGPDERDALCADQAAPRLTAELENRASRSPRIGVLRGLFAELASESVRHLMTQTVEILRGAGGVLNEVALPDSFDGVIRSHRVIMAVEAATQHQERFATHAGEYAPKIRELIEEGLRTPAIAYVLAKKQQQALSRDMLGCFRDADVLLTPATLGPPPDLSTTGDPAFNSPWSFTGLPTISFPAMITAEGLPLAIQLVGRPFGETELFRCALWCEEVVQARMDP